MCAGASAVGAGGTATAARGRSRRRKTSPYRRLRGLGLLHRLPVPADGLVSRGIVAGAVPADQTNASSIEVGRIFARGLSANALPAEDTKYVGQLVAQRTGMTPQDAEKRVTDTFAKAQQSIQDAEAKAKVAADKARKAAAYASLWIFISLLSGAFVSSLMATFGGRQRDL